MRSRIWLSGDDNEEKTKRRKWEEGEIRKTLHKKRNSYDRWFYVLKEPEKKKNPP